MASILFALALVLGLGTPSQAALIAHWKLDDNAASTTVVATVGSNATLEGGDNTNAKDVAGPGGSITAALDLNGSDDAIDISASSISISTGAAFSVSCWCEFDAANGTFIGRSADDSARVRKGSDTTIIVETSGGGTATFTVSPLGTSAWVHVLITRTSGNSMRCFVNATESSSGAISRVGSFAPTRIGRQSGSFFNGSVAQVKIFDSDESANVATLYAEGTGGGGAVPVIFRNWLNHSSLSPRENPFVRAESIINASPLRPASYFQLAP